MFVNRDFVFLPEKLLPEGHFRGSPPDPPETPKNAPFSDPLFWHPPGWGVGDPYVRRLKHRNLKKVVPTQLHGV